jgi:hypothetical protein
MLDCGDFAFVLEFRWRFLSLSLLLICRTFITGKLIFIISDMHIVIEMALLVCALYLLVSAFTFKAENHDEGTEGGSREGDA